MTAPRRPKGYSRKAWFHMSQARRKWTIWFLNFGPRVLIAGLTLPAREWFTLTAEE